MTAVLRLPIAPTQETPILAISAGPASLAQRLLPILGWLPAYRREWLLPDVLAGLAVWAVMVGFESNPRSNRANPPTKHVLLDAESVNVLDTTACDALLNLIRELQSQGTTFAFARVRDEVRERMRLGGVEAAVGPANFHERVTDGVRAWQQQEAPDGVPSGKS
jgi:MFS superfamily sulfate permease-like transporter